VQTYQKSLFLIGNPSEGGLVADEDLKTSFLPTLTSGVARSTEHVPSFTPLLNYLSDGELERSEKEREKELNRRRRKTTRGRRGVALPDREALKTCRTPAIGFSEVDSSALVNAAMAAPTTKRAAAAAASLTIANMVASENGTAVMQPSTPMNTPAAIPMQQQKEKKQRGLYKAPPYPNSVLRPRARVVAPTPSTGLDSSKPPASTDPAAAASAAAAPESRAVTKVLSAKKARELEKEAREKEYVDGQHPNWIDGVWHCSNCGCPESIAIGRRKGPLGEKSQCGTCG
jgi:SWI/SNF-related matrix-associated actin-dependent regulator of chromatin subfamily B member 1